MGITKRRIEAEEADINAEIQLCIRCDNRIGFTDEKTLSWQYEHSITGPFTTICLCSECKSNSLKRCVVCDAKALIDPSIPVCADCLDTYESKIEHLASESHCERCGSSIPRGEWDTFFDTGLCGYCSHMQSRWMSEEREEREIAPETQWAPEKDLALEERQIITPEEFCSSTISTITDPRLISYFASHPEDLRSLTPRQFEELVAELLHGFGYTVTLGKGSKDGGVDVFAEKETDTGTELSIVQCKRNRVDNKVGEPIVKQLYADVTTRNATRGLVVTTSTFTKDALKYIESLKYRLSPVDFDKLQSWLQNFKPSL